MLFHLAYNKCGVMQKRYPTGSGLAEWTLQGAISHASAALGAEQTEKTKINMT
jgi:hypothetical protein